MPQIALTGPSAIALHELDGFRNLAWPLTWCTPIGGQSSSVVFRCRGWQTPTVIDDVVVAPIAIALRHLNAIPEHLEDLPDCISPLDRVELAVEHSLRKKIDVASVRGSSSSGDTMLRDVLRRRGTEPPTESYAETRAHQLFRAFDLSLYRQVPVLKLGRTLHRADFLLPFQALKHRPATFSNALGLLIEIDSREFHEASFEKDQQRNATYNELGYHWVSFTPNQIEHEPDFVRRSLLGALAKADVAGAFPTLACSDRTPIRAVRSKMSSKPAVFDRTARQTA